LLSSKTATDGFHTGLEAYRKQDWESAERAFKSCLSIAPNDPVPNVFLDQITHFKAQPPGSEWAGVWKFQTK
jgi:adenylate cyclase